MSRVATGSSDVGTSQNMLIYVKRLANKTTHCNCSSKRVNNQVKVYDQPKGWWRWDENNQASSDEKADRMAITRVKMEMGSFLHKLEP